VIRRPLAALAVALVASAGCQKPMAEYTNSQYKFTAMFPGTPKEQSQSAAGVAFKMFGTEDKNGAFMVGVGDMPIGENESAEQTRMRLDGAQAGAIANVGGSLKASKDVQLDGKYPGREFSASITKPTTGQVRARVYLVGRRMYQVMVIGTDSYATSARANQFMDSFKLTP
jgi:hypothetical protein